MIRMRDEPTHIYIYPYIYIYIYAILYSFIFILGTLRIVVMSSSFIHVLCYAMLFASEANCFEASKGLRSDVMMNAL